MIGPRAPLQGLATGYHLPKSNHAWRLAISHEIETAAGSLDRRAIPAGASESFWMADDGHAIRRIEWSAAKPRGSLLFFPGRGDHYEKYLETLAQWHDAGWRVTRTEKRRGGKRVGRTGRTRWE